MGTKLQQSRTTIRSCNSHVRKTRRKREDMEITETPKAKVGAIVVEIWPYELVVARVRTTRNDSFISGTEFNIELKLDEDGNYIDYL